MPGLIAIASVIYAGLGVLWAGLPVIRKGSDLMGNPPVHRIAWIGAKLALFVTIGWAPAAVFSPGLAMFAVPVWMAFTAVFIYAIGALGDRCPYRDLGRPIREVINSSGDDMLIVIP